jgi:hypothetical protein
MGYPFVVGTAVTAEIEDSSCALGAVSGQLAAEGVHVSSCCCFSRAEGRATWAVPVDDEERAREILGLQVAADYGTRDGLAWVGSSATESRLSSCG